MRETPKVNGFTGFKLNDLLRFSPKLSCHVHKPEARRWQDCTAGEALQRQNMLLGPRGARRLFFSFHGFAGVLREDNANHA